jgi:signal peptide peptidase SppA
MFRIKLAGKILSNVWLISPAYVHAIMPGVIALLKGEKGDDDFSSIRADHRPFLYMDDDDASIKTTAGPSSPFENASPGSVAVISLKGVMMKDDQWCGPQGTATIAEYIRKADANPNISSIVLKIDSPGGTVDGTETLAKTIKSTKKPVVAWVDGTMASAAMWAGSACDEIIASGKTDVIGSIGTMMSFADVRPVFEQQGVVFHDILASQSTNKNIEFREALKGNYSPLIENILDPTNKVFIKAIKENRAGKLDPENEEVFTGKIYLAEQAKKAGLIDDIGELDFAVSRAQKLAGTKAQNSNSTPNMKVNLKASWTALVAFFGLTAAANQETVEHDITAQELESINQRMMDHDALVNEMATLRQSNTDLTNQLSAAQREIATLSGAPAATTEVVKTIPEKVESADHAPVNSWDIKARRLDEIHGK